MVFGQLKLNRRQREGERERAGEREREKERICDHGDDNKKTRRTNSFARAKNAENIDEAKVHSKTQQDSES